LPYFLALAAAAFYGAADFLGGLAARRAHTAAVVVVSGAAGLAVLVLLLPWVPGPAPREMDLLWGAAAGLSGGIAVGLLYRALAIGRMAVVAPTTAVCAVAVPALTAFALGERLHTMTLAGVALALVAIVLVSQQKPEGTDVRTRSIGLALVSGVAMGGFYVALAETSPEAGLWPLLMARGTSITLFGIMALLGRQSLRMEAPVLRMVLLGGVLDMTANALYVFATHGGPLSVVVTLCSLYPASTVLLARIVLGERMSPWQLAGVGCAVVAVALIVSAT
jgi:drug/metabolite transporter (DMT)-like permease